MNDLELMYSQVWQKKPRGRPSSLTTRLAERIYFLASKGLTDAQIAWFLDVSRTTLYRWKHGSLVFKKKLEEAKSEADNAIEKALFQRARGLTVTEKRTVRTIQTVNGKATEVFIERELPPDAHACLMWLRNRRPDRWGPNARPATPDWLKELSISPTPVVITIKTKQICEAVTSALEGN